jgi:hypothetical protein
VEQVPGLTVRYGWVSTGQGQGSSRWLSVLPITFIRLARQSARRRGWRCGGMRLWVPVRIPGYPLAGDQTWMRPDLFSTTITASAQLSTLANGNLRATGAGRVVTW